MTMTPFAPRTPYIVMSAASLSALMEAMSYGLIPDSPPSVDGWKGTPSTMYSGALLPYVELEPPRMRTVSVPSAARPMSTPAECEARYRSMGMLGFCSISASFGDADAALGVGAAPLRHFAAARPTSPS